MQPYSPPGDEQSREQVRGLLAPAREQFVIAMLYVPLLCAVFVPAIWLCFLFFFGYRSGNVLRVWNDTAFWQVAVVDNAWILAFFSLVAAFSGLFNVVSNERARQRNHIRKMAE